MGFNFQGAEIVSGFVELFQKSTGKEPSTGVQSIHYVELDDFYKRVREDELRNTAAMLAVLMQDIDADPTKAQDILCSEMARTWEKIRALDVSDDPTP